VHRTYGLDILSNDVFQTSPALPDVATQTPDQPYIGVGINVDLEIEKLTQARFGEHQDSLEENHRPRFDEVSGGGSPVADEVIYGNLDRPARLEITQVMHQKIVVQSLWVIEVVMQQLRVRLPVDVSVIAILGQESDTLGPDGLQNSSRHRGLARPGAAGHTESYGGFGLAARHG
jgi:hypothetical protein